MTHTSHTPSRGNSRHGSTHDLLIEVLEYGEDKYKVFAEFSCVAPTWRAWVRNEDGRTEDVSVSDAVDALMNSVNPGTGDSIAKA